MTTSYLMNDQPTNQPTDQPNECDKNNACMIDRIICVFKYQYKYTALCLLNSYTYRSFVGLVLVSVQWRAFAMSLFTLPIINLVTLLLQGAFLFAFKMHANHKRFNFSPSFYRKRRKNFTPVTIRSISFHLAHCDDRLHHDDRQPKCNKIVLQHNEYYIDNDGIALECSVTIPVRSYRIECKREKKTCQRIKIQISSVERVNFTDHRKQLLSLRSLRTSSSPMPHHKTLSHTEYMHMSTHYTHLRNNSDAVHCTRAFHRFKCRVKIIDNGFFRREWNKSDKGAQQE